MAVLGIFSTIFSFGSRTSQRLLVYANVISLSYFVLIYSVNVYLAYFHIIPQRFGNSETLVWRNFIATGFLAMNVIGNYINTYRTDTSIKTLRLDKIKDREYKQECSVCLRGVPERVHHCKLCKTCILKRDHHCFFMNTCIGYFNQKYFIMFLFYTAAGGMYCTVLLAIHMHMNYQIVFKTLLTFVTLLPTTVLGWWFQTIKPAPSNGLLATVGLFYGTLFGCVFATGMLLWQLYIVSQGQTTHEAKHGTKDFKKSLGKNLSGVFGPYWYITLVLPVVLPQGGDGSFTSHSDTSKRKGSDRTTCKTSGSKPKRT